MSDSNFIQFVNSAFSSLPICDEPFFIELWDKGKLTYVNNPDVVDIIDEQNSKLICTALEKRKPFLIVLPDDEMHRGALMFGTVLIKSAVECIQYQKKNHTVLYFGTSAGFKYSLAKTSVGNLTLDNVFSYSQASGKYSQSKNNNISSKVAEYLPEVICVYHPDNPKEYIQNYKPNWIAIDCGKNIEIEWLNELLRYCKKKYKPVIAWSQNGFSNIIELFEEFQGNIYYAPKKLSEGKDTSIGELFFDTEQCTVKPITFSKDSIAEIDEALYKAKGILRNLNNDRLGNIEKDTIRTSWIFLRTVERLAIPVSIYNSEARAFRYVYSLDSLNNTLTKYINYTVVANPSFATKIEEFKNITNEVVSTFVASEPPYWSALSDYCLDRAPEGSIRIIAFPKRHQKQLFSYILLSKFNIREDELLEDSRIILRTLGETAIPKNADKSIHSEFNIIPIIAGLPDYYNRHLFYQIINKWNTKVMIYPHQVGILNAIIRDFNTMEQRQLQKSIQSLTDLTKYSGKINSPANRVRYTLSKTSTEIKIEFDKSSKVQRTEVDNLVNIGDLHTELSQLLETGDRDEEDIEYLVNINVATKDEDGEGRDRSLLVEDAIEVILQNNYRLVVDPFEQVSVLREGKVDKLYVRGLRQGDKIVLIENQSRQSLYDLIISRVHNHPSLEIHLGMLKKWKEDFYLNYTKWKENFPTNGLWEFLQLLQTKGSQITTALTINNWVNGYVMSPHDEEDLRRIGEILDMRFLRENYSKVHNAASRISGIHRSLSRKLNNWLEKRASNYHHSDMDLIDEELGLTFGELRSSIKVLKVKTIKDLSEPTLRNHLGRLEKID